MKKSLPMIFGLFFLISLSSLASAGVYNFYLRTGSPYHYYSVGYASYNPYGSTDYYIGDPYSSQIERYYITAAPSYPYSFTPTGYYYSYPSRAVYWDSYNYARVYPGYTYVYPTYAIEYG